MPNFDADSTMAPTIKLYGLPFACSIAAHTLLEDSGLEYEFFTPNLSDPDMRAEYIKTVNPKGQIPALSINNDIVTEAPAVLYAISQLVPAKQYVGTDLVSFMEWMNFISGSIHTKTLVPLLRASMFTDDLSAEPSIKAKALKNAAAALKLIEDKLDESGFALDGHLTGVDVYITWVIYWAKRLGFWDESFVRVATLVKNVEAFGAYQRVLEYYQSER